jgi:hypothetical protein
MCDVRSTAVLCSESVECFPGMASKFICKPFVTVPVVPKVIGVILYFKSTFVVSIYMNCCILAYYYYYY